MFNRYNVIFKEDFSPQGRGGYFDDYGVIRDMMQNHLMQVLTLIAMEQPPSITGEDCENCITDAKVELLKAIAPLHLENVVLGQYVRNDKGMPGYTEDPTVPDDSLTPTLCRATLHINNSRWNGVPFIMEAAKAVDEYVAAVRIVFKPSQAGGLDPSPNELILQLQPEEAVFFKVNMKKPGLMMELMRSQLELVISKDQFEYVPDAYSRLILDTIEGKRSSFVRTDELEESWRVFDPLLREIEEKKVKPITYVYGSKGLD